MSSTSWNQDADCARVKMSLVIKGCWSLIWLLSFRVHLGICGLPLDDQRETAVPRLLCPICYKLKRGRGKEKTFPNLGISFFSLEWYQRLSQAQEVKLIPLSVKTFKTARTFWGINTLTENEALWFQVVAVDSVGTFCRKLPELADTFCRIDDNMFVVFVILFWSASGLLGCLPSPDCCWRRYLPIFLLICNTVWAYVWKSIPVFSLHVSFYSEETVSLLPPPAQMRTSTNELGSSCTALKLRQRRIWLVWTVRGLKR